MSYLVAHRRRPLTRPYCHCNPAVALEAIYDCKCPIAMTLMEGIDLDAGSYGSASGVLCGGGPGDRDRRAVSREIWRPGLCPPRNRAQPPCGREARAHGRGLCRDAG